ncbi:MAG: TetR/AcrR family transcriptional regulator [Rhizobiales bacterium]|nr:TetR/AcrR family transcriptional regulator [Hyphomicrobiales bacterium]MBN9010540.1 TetR/AcrR family transcriptional regulator [Hyphomicrobiales bacterium]
MRDQIKALAKDLLIQRGYRGVSFGDLASALNTTRANIHYHFGNKQKLVSEVLNDYIKATLAEQKHVWGDPGARLVDRIGRTVEYSHRRYAKYNPPGKSGHPWSLIARMRQDSDALTPKDRASLRRFGEELHGLIVAAIEDAKARGEFVATMPVQDVALQLVGVANSAGPITQDAGNFDRLEQLYMGFARIIAQAFGTEKAAAAPKYHRRDHSEAHTHRTLP